MRPRLNNFAALQGGLFTRAQALTAGYTDREIKAATRPDGPWLVVRLGTYAERSFVAELDQRERWMLKDRAAAMMSPRAGALSHDSAARSLRIRMLDVDVPRSHLTYYGPQGSRTRAGVTRHRDLLPLCVEVVDGQVMTSYARTAIDIGRLHGYQHGLVAVDSVRFMGVTTTELEAELARMERHPHIARARAAVRASDAGAESALETLGRQLVEELDLGPVETQFAVRIAGGRTVWCDIRLGRHLVECHGKIKLLPPEQGGVATHAPTEVLWNMKKRQTLVCAEGFGMSEIYWHDLFGPARERTKARLLREYAVTETRFGRQLPEHLRRFADAHPRQRHDGLWVPWHTRDAA